ncbi:MAG: 5-amino-6-(D-ribitylamino)uracil--L-tyrosine 4-hydroxyphenyl transferase CofH, partial [Pseudomonadota bacterium]
RPKLLESAYLKPAQVLEIARAGAANGCKEALFTLGDKPELRYSAARDQLEELGYETTLDYLHAMADLVRQETGLLPHVNPGIMTMSEMKKLRTVSISMGIMLETLSDRLSLKGGCHFGSPDKNPDVRIRTIAEAGEAKIPFTSGILIGIGETRVERIESLMALRDLHSKYGHIQEIIVQNFRAKPDTKMADAPEPSFEDLQWTIAAARLIFGPEMSIQAPPNLSSSNVKELIDSGINDFGGISPVTPDHVNPEAPWPHLSILAKQVSTTGRALVERLGVYPSYAHDAKSWVDPSLSKAVLSAIDSEGLARTSDWCPGESNQILPDLKAPFDLPWSQDVDDILHRLELGVEATENDVLKLLMARGEEIDQVIEAADDLRKNVCGDTVSYVVTRNINYTNVCYFKCKFCAFSKGKTSENLRGKPYDLGLDEIVARAKEAWDRGAVELCLQGGIHPSYTGQTYIDILTAIKTELPNVHIHAFSPLEIHQGAQTLGLSVEKFLDRLVGAGLGSLPGTAAEILDDEVRRELCPDKINTAEWFHVVDTAHRAGLKTTATIMFGHLDKPIHWARHLIRLRDQQKKTGGFTELVPLPFVHMESPMFLKGISRRGPTWRESLLLHAVARLVLHPHIRNIQASWVKLGVDGIVACLEAGANDIGGTLMNETITRSAGAKHGQEMTPETMEDLLVSAGRPPRQRSTLYGSVSNERYVSSFGSQPLKISAAGGR